MSVAPELQNLRQSRCQCLNASRCLPREAPPISGAPLNKPHTAHMLMYSKGSSLALRPPTLQLQCSWGLSGPWVGEELHRCPACHADSMPLVAARFPALWLQGPPIPSNQLSSGAAVHQSHCDPIPTTNDLGRHSKLRGRSNMSRILLWSAKYYVDPLVCVVSLPQSQYLQTPDPWFLDRMVRRQTPPRFSSFFCKHV
jgi:hypothetical protein